MNNAKIIGVYSSDRETGKEYITQNGNPYIKLALQKDDGTKIYDAFFFTEKAHWKVEQFFKAMGRVAPQFAETTYKNFLEFKDEDVFIEDGTDKKGYAKVYKYVQKQPSAATIAEDIDEELNEDVPF